MPYEFTYIKDHGTPVELIDRAFSIIEGWIDSLLIRVAETEGESRVYREIGKLTFHDKLDLMIPEGVDQLPEEGGARHIWQELYDLVDLRPKLDAPGDEQILQRWLDERGWYNQELDIPQAPEPLQSEIILRILLDGSLIYLEGWFSELKSC